jgi:iron complex transport system ATP-binding protein
MKPDSPILESRGLSVGYNGISVIEDINIKALRGQVICLLGPNGSGKSTILRTLAGLLEPVRGAVYVSGNRLEKIKPADKAKSIAAAFTETISAQFASVFELAAMGRTPHTGFFGKLTAEDRRVVNESLELAGAARLAGRKYSSLSDGEKQKVIIARALAQQPGVIILDEPTSHLDIKHKIEALRILNRLSRERGLTVILSLHDIDIALKACEYVILVNNGRISAAGSPEDLIDKINLNSIFGIEGAFYDSLLGGIELCDNIPPRVFIIAGAGTGAPIYRMASRLGIGAATGILHKNDIDYRIAEDMRLSIVAEDSFKPISENKTREAWKLMNETDFIVDSGFPTGDFNRENVMLFRRAALSGLRCISMRGEEESLSVYG